MTIKIFHTADVHVGMTMGRYDGVSKDLIEARFQNLGTLIELATAKECQLFVVAGDLFNTITQKDKAIERWGQALRSSPRQLPTYLGLAELLATTLNPQQVGEALRKIPRTQDDMVDQAVAWLYSRRGDHAKAAEVDLTAETISPCAETTVVT